MFSVPNTQLNLTNSNLYTFTAVAIDQECVCDTCGAVAMGRVFLGIALSPPAGWFVHGKIAMDEIIGDVDQFLYCSEKCAAPRSTAASATSTPASAAFSTEAALMPLVSWV